MRRMSRDPAAVLPPETARRISREEMSELPIQRYQGSVHLVAAPQDLLGGNGGGRQEQEGQDSHGRTHGIGFGRMDSHPPPMV